MCVFSSIAKSLSDHKEAIEAFKNLCEAAAIGLGGLWTYYFFVLKREKYPRAKLGHQILHWTLADGKTAIRVIVKIDNKGEVLLKLNNGFTWLQQVTPLTKTLAEAVQAQTDLVKENETEIQWPIIGERNFFKTGKIEIEPGENDEVDVDFIIGADVEKILVYSHVENEVKRKPSWLDQIKSGGEKKSANKQQLDGGGMGWNVSTLFDLSKHENKHQQ